MLKKEGKKNGTENVDCTWTCSQKSAASKSQIKASGDSSFKYLQNVYTNRDVQNQAVSIALAVSENVLGNHGVCRVHGGGFAGTIQAFVKNDFVEEYRKALDAVFGEGSCHVLKVRKYGGMKVIA